MVTLVDPILPAPAPPEGIELPPLPEPPTMADRMFVEASKRDKVVEWNGSRGALKAVVRQLETYGWKVTVRREVALDPV